jgi:hypothetical protein
MYCNLKSKIENELNNKKITLPSGVVKSVTEFSKFKKKVSSDIGGKYNLDIDDLMSLNPKNYRVEFNDELLNQVDKLLELEYLFENGLFNPLDFQIIKNNPSFKQHLINNGFISENQPVSETLNDFINDIQRKVINQSPLLRQQLYEIEKTTDDFKASIKDGLNMYETNEVENVLRYPFMYDNLTVALTKYFLALNPNAQINLTDMPSNSVANIAEFAIRCAKNRFIEDMPEEVAHFYVAYLPEDSKLLKNLIDEVINHPIYQETLELYSKDSMYQLPDGSPNIAKIKKEAVGKLISLYLKNSNGKQINQKKKSVVQKLVDAFIKYFKKLFLLSPDNRADYKFQSEFYTKVTNDILTGDVTEMWMEKPISPEENQFLNILIDNQPEKNIQNIEPIQKAVNILKRNLVSQIQEILTEDRFMQVKDMFSQSEQLLYQNSLSQLEKIKESLNDLKKRLSPKDIINPEHDKALILDSIVEQYEHFHRLAETIKNVNDIIENDNDIEKIFKSIGSYRMFLKVCENFKKSIQNFNLSIKSAFEEEDRELSKKFTQQIGDIETSFVSAENQIKKKAKEHLKQYFKTRYEELTAELVIKKDKIQEKIMNSTMSAEEKQKRIYYLNKQRELILTDRALDAIIDGVNIYSREEFGVSIDENGVVTGENKTVQIDISNYMDLTNFDLITAFMADMSDSKDPITGLLAAEYIKKMLDKDAVSFEESLILLNKVQPMLDTLLAGSQFNYYSLHQEIMKLQDVTADQKKYTFLYMVNYLQAYKERREKDDKLDEVKKQFFKKDKEIKQSIKDNKPQEDIDKLIEEKNALNDEIKRLVIDLNVFLNENMHREYTPEFYRIRDTKYENSEHYFEINEVRKLQADIKHLVRKKFEIVTSDNYANAESTIGEQFIRLNKLEAELRNKLLAKLLGLPEQIREELKTDEEKLYVEDTTETYANTYEFVQSLKEKTKIGIDNEQLIEILFKSTKLNQTGRSVVNEIRTNRLETLTAEENRLLQCQNTFASDLVSGLDKIRKENNNELFKLRRALTNKFTSSVDITVFLYASKEMKDILSRISELYTMQDNLNASINEINRNRQHLIINNSSIKDEYDYRGIKLYQSIFTILRGISETNSAYDPAVKNTYDLFRQISNFDNFFKVLEGFFTPESIEQYKLNFNINNIADISSLQLKKELETIEYQPGYFKQIISSAFNDFIRPDLSNNKILLNYNMFEKSVNDTSAPESIAQLKESVKEELADIRNSRGKFWENYNLIETKTVDLSYLNEFALPFINLFNNHLGTLSQDLDFIQVYNYIKAQEGNEDVARLFYFLSTASEGNKSYYDVFNALDEKGDPVNLKEFLSVELIESLYYELGNYIAIFRGKEQEGSYSGLNTLIAEMIDDIQLNQPGNIKDLQLLNFFSASHYQGKKYSEIIEVDEWTDTEQIRLFGEDVFKISKLIINKNINQEGLNDFVSTYQDDTILDVSEPEKMVTVSYPGYTRYKVNPIFENTDEKAGEPIKDNTGRYLPKSTGKFRNDDYFKLKNAPENSKEGMLFKYLNTLQEFYLKQQEKLPEKDRLFLDVPIKSLDAFEEKKAYIAGIAGFKSLLEPVKGDESDNYLKLKTREFFFPFLGKDDDVRQTVERDEQFATPVNYDRITQEQLEEQRVKIPGNGRINPVMQSKNLLGIVVNFASKMHQYEVKSDLESLFYISSITFQTALTSSEVNGVRTMQMTNKRREDILKKKLGQLIYDTVPNKDLLNSPIVRKIIQSGSLLARNKMILKGYQPIVNYIGGTIQISLLLRKYPQLGKAWRKTLTRNPLFSAKMDTVDLSRYSFQSNQFKSLSKNFLIAHAFGFFQDNKNLSTITSRSALIADISRNLLFLKQASENALAVKVGLLAMFNQTAYDKDGKEHELIDIYEKDENTGMLVLKPNFDPVKYDPYKGTISQKVRQTIYKFNYNAQGGYNEHGRSYISSSAVGKGFETMSKWFFPLTLTKWAPRKIDYITGLETYGSYRMIWDSAATVLKIAMGKDTKNIGNTRSEKFGNFMKYGIWDDEVSRAALFTALQDLAFYPIGILLLSLLGFDSDDEDKWKKMRTYSWAEQYSIMLILKSMGEQGAFLPLPMYPFGFDEWKRKLLNPISIPSQNIGTAMNLVKYVWLTATGADDKKLYYQKASPDAYWYKQKGDSKLRALTIETFFGNMGADWSPTEFAKIYYNNQTSIR